VAKVDPREEVGKRCRRLIFLSTMAASYRSRCLLKLIIVVDDKRLKNILFQRLMKQLKDKLENCNFKQRGRQRELEREEPDA